MQNGIGWHEFHFEVLQARQAPADAEHVGAKIQIHHIFHLMARMRHVCIDVVRAVIALKVGDRAMSVTTISVKCSSCTMPSRMSRIKPYSRRHVRVLSCVSVHMDAD